MTSSTPFVESELESGTERPRQLLCQDAHVKGKAQPDGVTCAKCYNGQFTQPQPKQVKIDILFVADTSPSLEQERSAIAAGIGQFLSALPQHTDYHIAVMAAHSDKSYDPANKKSTGLAGQLLVVGNEPAVLKNKPAVSKKANDSDWSELVPVLMRKLKNPPRDGATDGGEVGLFSLDKGISEPLLSKNRKLGFFRPDAALAVIFISDENDICSYGVNYPAGIVPKKNVNMYLKTGLTVEEKANQAYCRDENGNPTVTSRSVFIKLRNLMGSSPSPATNAKGQPPVANPLLISGILYSEESSVPTTPAPDEKYPEYFGENEVGYGYIDIIHDNQGVVVDISKGDFDKGLRQIGEEAAKKLEVKSEFQLKEGAEIDPNSLCVLVDGREASETNSSRSLSTSADTSKTPAEAGAEAATYAFLEDLREVHLRSITSTNQRGDPSKVEIFYCEPPSMNDFERERTPYIETDLPTREEHYRRLPVPGGCHTLKQRLQSGQF